MASDRGPLLVIEELPQPVYISIFGVRYPVRTPAERSYAETIEMAQMHTRNVALIDDDTEESVRALAASIRRFCSLVLPDAPDEILDRLTDNQRVQIVETFNNIFGFAA